MRIRSLLTVTGALALVTPAIAAAQAQRPRLDVAVRVESVALSGDTIEIGYVVKNRPASPFRLWIFGLFTSAPVVSVTAPADNRRWKTGRNYAEEAMPHWAAMRPIAAGDSTLPLRLRAIGVTDLVPFLAVPDFTQIRDTVEDDEPHDQWREAGTVGTVLAVVPPPNLTPSQQMTRIIGFMTRSCGADTWITNDGICNSLTGKLDRAAVAIGEGNMVRARPHLASFLEELEAQRGKHVSEVAYALLRPNVAYLMR